MPTEEFVAWANKHRLEVTGVQELLKTPLSEDMASLRGQLIGIEGWNARVSTMVAQAESYLSAAEDSEMGKLLEGEKLAPSLLKIRLKFMTRQERRVRDVLKGLSHATEYRLMLGMSLMKAHNIEMAAARAAA
jgi:hypothetical protein